MICVSGAIWWHAPVTTERSCVKQKAVEAIFIPCSWWGSYEIALGVLDHSNVLGNTQGVESLQCVAKSFPNLYASAIWCVQSDSFVWNITIIKHCLVASSNPSLVFMADEYVKVETASDACIRGKHWTELVSFFASFWITTLGASDAPSFEGVPAGNVQKVPLPNLIYVSWKTKDGPGEMLVRAPSKKAVRISSEQNTAVKLQLTVQSKKDPMAVRAYEPDFATLYPREIIQAIRQQPKDWKQSFYLQQKPGDRKLKVSKEDVEGYYSPLVCIREEESSTAWYLALLDNEWYLQRAITRLERKRLFEHRDISLSGTLLYQSSDMGKRERVRSKGSWHVLGGADVFEPIVRLQIDVEDDSVVASRESAFSLRVSASDGSRNPVELFSYTLSGLQIQDGAKSDPTKKDDKIYNTYEPSSHAEVFWIIDASNRLRKAVFNFHSFAEIEKLAQKGPHTKLDKNGVVVYDYAEEKGSTVQSACP